MSRPKWVISLLLLVASAGCTTPGASGVTAPHSTPSVEASERAPIPDELVGDWESRKGTDPVILTLQESGAYRVKRGLARGMGAMAAVSVRQLDFFGGDPCPERGSYEWTIEGDTLTFTPLGEDECPGRAAVLDGLTYTRASDEQ
jgi:hypothetical protein